MKLTNIKWLRAAKCIAVCILATALPWMAHAQAVSTTTVQGTVYLANGQPGAGTLQLSWPAFTTAADQAIAAGRLTVAIGAGGFVSVNLAPNLGSSPAGLYYTAVYYMSDGTTSTEYWVVPATAQATIAQIRAQVMPAAQALQTVDKAYVDQAIQSAAQGALSPTGGTLSGPLYLSSDPTQTMQAADKHYVDISFGQAVPLSGGSLTGPLNAPTLNASVNGQINIMAPGLGASDNTCTGDDTAALLAAQTLAKTFAVNGVRPATIYFPPGCYNISPSAGWWQGVSLIGGGSPSSNGSHGVIIKQTVPGADVISAADPSLVTSTYFNSSWSISHLTLVVNDGAQGTHPHRWPGRWFDDAAMTSGSAILKTTNGGVTCGDTGQAISVAGAGAAGAALVTTILSVSPCWAQSGSAWQAITLAASASTTVTLAHTYISVANLPVTTNLGAAGIAFDNYDGKAADWPGGSLSTSSSYSHIDDVTVVSASYTNHGLNNSVGLYTQGSSINYALKVRNSNFNRVAFGIVQQTSELNSYNASSNGDYQSWRDIQTNGDNVPFVAVNGETATFDNWENNSTPIGFQVYRMTNGNADTPDGWVLSNISGGGSSGTTLGWNIAGNNWTVADVAFGNNAYIDTTYSSFTNSIGYLPNFGGNSNTFLGGNQFTGTPVNGAMGNVATVPGTNSLGMPNSKYFPAVPYKGSNHLAGRFTPDFIQDGNALTTPYSHDDLFIWPSDMMFNPSGNPIWNTYYTADSTATTGATFNFVSGGLGGSNFQQFDGPGGTGGIPVIGTNVPQKSLYITLSAKCDSSTTYGFKAAVFNGTATHTATGSCTTSFQTISFVLPITSADLTHNLYFAGTTANNLRVQWIDIQPLTNPYVLDASQFSGADFGAKVSACLTAVEAAGGGTCDARNFSSTQTSSSTITVGDGTHQTNLLLPNGTITASVTPALLFHAYSSTSGQALTTVLCTNPSAPCIRNANDSGGTYDIKVSNLSVGVSGTATSTSVGIELGGGGYTDVLESTFTNLSSNGFATGTFLDGIGGCLCYNDFTNIDSRGTVIGIKTQNDSGYAYGVNSNHWTGGKGWGPIGLYDSGTTKFTWNYVDFEGNTSSTGAILYSNPDGNNAGTGYVVGDTVRPAGGDSTAVLRVAATSGGAVTALTITTAGTTYVNNNASITTTTLTGSGSGLKVDLVVSAMQLLLSNGGDMIINPYEEAGAADYICGTGNFVLGAWGASNGSVPSPRYCTGPTNQYSGPASNLVWGTSSTPNSIGVRTYIAFYSSLMYDPFLSFALTPPANSHTANLYQDGPIYAGQAGEIYGYYGHSPWNTGLDKPHSGIVSTGAVSINQLANPSPTLTAVGGIGTTSPAYGLVCNDANGGKTLPVTPASTVSGPANLGTFLTLAVAAGGTGYVSGDVGATITITGNNSSGSSGTATIASVSGGAVTGVTLVAGGSGYVTSEPVGTGYNTSFATVGGTGTGLKVSGTSTYIQVAYPSEDGCASWTVLKTDTSHQLPALNSQLVGSSNIAANIYDFGATTVAYSPGSRNTTGDESVAGNQTVIGSMTANGISTPTTAAGNATFTQTIASGATALATTAITSATCQTVTAGSVNSAAATGVVGTDAITFTPNASIKAVTGYTPGTSGGLTITAYPTAGYVNFDVCNWASTSITPGAVTLNWKVTR